MVLTFSSKGRRMIRPYTEIEELIPHRNGMRLVQVLVEADEGSAVTETTVTESWPTCVDGKVEALILVELIAQSVSAMEGFSGRIEREGEKIGEKGGGGGSHAADDEDDETEHRDGQGLLVGVREARMSASFVPVGSVLTTRVSKLWSRDKYGVYNGIVQDETGKELCKAEIQAYRHPEGMEFLLAGLARLDDA